MIKLVNESLFKQKTEVKQYREGDKCGKEFYLTSFKSAEKTPNPKIKGAFSARNIISVMHTEEGNFNQQNTKVDVHPGKGSTTMIRISQGDYRFDTEVYLVAIPYSGIMKPIPEMKELRVYRGVTIRANKRTIEFNESYFNKVAFMVIALNPSLFDESSKYYKDHLDFVVETFNLEDTEEQDVKKTVKTTYTVTFYPDKDAEFSFVNEEVDPIDPSAYKGEKVFPLYQLPADGKREYKAKTDRPEKKDDPVDKAEEASDKEEENNVPEKSEKADPNIRYTSGSIGDTVIPKGKTLDDMLNDVKKVEKDNNRALANRSGGYNKKKKKRKKH